MNSDHQTSSESNLSLPHSSNANPPSKKKNKLSSRIRVWTLRATAFIVLWLIGVMVYQTHKPLPPGISYESPLYHVNNVSFWHDTTYSDGSETGKQHLSLRGMFTMPAHTTLILH